MLVLPSCGPLAWVDGGWFVRCNEGHCTWLQDKCVKDRNSNDPMLVHRHRDLLIDNPSNAVVLGLVDEWLHEERQKTAHRNVPACLAHLDRRRRSLFQRQRASAPEASFDPLHDEALRVKQFSDLDYSKVLL